MKASVNKPCFKGLSISLVMREGLEAGIPSSLVSVSLAGQPLKLTNLWIAGSITSAPQPLLQPVLPDGMFPN
jgi:hypothetical protein